MGSRNFIPNKRGDISITILVIGVFFVCTLAIASFFYSGVLLKKSFDGVSLMEKANIEIEKNLSEPYHDEIVKQKFSLSFDFDFLKDKIIFSVDYLGNGE